MSTTLTISDLREGFARPPRAARPMMRWWWFGPDVEDDELDAELRAIADAGFGGVEISYVYPLSPSPTHCCPTISSIESGSRPSGPRRSACASISRWGPGGPSVARTSMPNTRRDSLFGNDARLAAVPSTCRPMHSGPVTS
jgi:hypothetical protein